MKSIRSQKQNKETFPIFNGYEKRAKKTATNEIETFYYCEHYELSNESETKYIFDSNQRIAQVTSTVTQLFHKDHLGSITALHGDARHGVSTTLMSGGEEMTSIFSGVYKRRLL